MTAPADPTATGTAHGWRCQCTVCFPVTAMPAADQPPAVQTDEEIPR